MGRDTQPSASAAADLRLRLPSSVAVVRGDESIMLGAGRGGLTLTGPMLALEPVISALQDGAREADLLGGISDPALAPLLFYLLAQMDAKGLISRTAMLDATPLATLRPIAGKRVATRGAVDPDARWRLSRFAYLRREGDDLVLESPLAVAQIILHGPAVAAALQCLSAPTSARDLDEQGLPLEPACALLGLLSAGGFVDPENAIESDSARLWEFHDLLFHARSRLGRHDQPYGGAYAFADIEPLAALKPPGQGERIILAPATELDSSQASLQTVMMRRRSLRTHSTTPIDRARLGAFLHRAARHLKTLPTEHGELAARPYPAGGALYELELYLVVDRCDDLARGLYHYRPGEHALERRPEVTAATEALLDQASATLSGAGRPQVLIVVAARFGRLAWKYRSVAYALVLKHVGVLYQTLYLVATDMDLAPCAMGGGDSDLFAEASGLDPLAEPSVGEFALGSRETDADGR